MQELTAWTNFYYIVGAAGGALIGLQFVVVTLVAQRPPVRAAEAGAAFATPNIIHFGVVLLLAAVATIPWHGFGVVSLVWGVIGVSGIAYTLLVFRRMRSQRAYKPVFEDWSCHVLLPIVAYIVLTVSALLVHLHSRRTLFFIGAATLLLLFVGIHNAWDAATYHIFVYRGDDGPS